MKKVLILVALVIMSGCSALPGYKHSESTNYTQVPDITKIEDLNCNGKNYPLLASKIKIDEIYKDYKMDVGHIFCGEINKRGKGVGYHFFKNKVFPSSIKAKNTTKISKVSASIYKVQDFLIIQHDKKVTKKLSTMFPLECEKEQVANSIAYVALTNKKQTPKDNDKYCLNSDGETYNIKIYKNNKVISTGFPSI